MEKCPDCGAALAPEAQVCPQCGCQLNNQVNAPQFTYNNLIQGEKIICSAKWHWINYATFILLGIFGLFCFIYPLTKSEYLYYLDLEYLEWCGWLFCLIFLFFSIYGIISIKYNEFVVTNRRILIKSGIIRRASYELRLEKLESIQVYQGICGRLLGYGTILVHGVGASRQSVMRINSPLVFRQHIFTELSKQNNQTEE